MNLTKQGTRYQRMTEDKLYPLLWRMAVPSMIGMMVSSIYSMTDTFFVGLLGRTELTASVGIVFSFISVIQAIGFWFGYGSGNYISRQIGKKNFDEAENMAATGFVLAIIVGMSILAGGFFLIRPLARFLGAGITSELMEATVSYLRITLLSVPYMLASNVLYNELRLQGGAKDSMLGLLVGMLLNIILDPVFILVFDMSVAGAALASLIGQVTGLVILLIFLGKNDNVPIHLGKCKLDLFHIKEILTGGAPNFCRQGISSLATVLINQTAGMFGEACIASVTIALRIISMGYALVIGFGQGYQPVCAINYGAGKIHRVKTGFLYAFLTATGFLFVASIIISINAETLIGCFSNISDVKMIGARLLRMQCLVLPFMGYYILIGMLLQNIGKFGLATLVTIAENGFFLIPAVLILPRIGGLDGLVLCNPAASACALIFSLFIGTNAFKKYLTTKEIGGD